MVFWICFMWLVVGIYLASNFWYGVLLVFAAAAITTFLTRE